MPDPKPRNHSPTIRLLGEQVTTALRACGELRADLRTLDDDLDEVKTHVAVLKERMTIIAGILAVIQVLGMAIAAYLAGR